MHIHIPDGVFPFWLWLLAFILTFILLIFVSLKVKGEKEKIPLTGILTALILLVMTIPLGLPFHLNLIVLAGILLGSYWVFLLIFIVNLILASFGHGGITIVGLNTLFLWIQAFLGIFLFKSLFFYSKKIFWSGVLATFLSLIISYFLMLGTISLGEIDFSQTLPALFGPQKLDISLSTFILLSFPLVLLGTIIESFVTGFTLQFLKKISPNLLK